MTSTARDDYLPIEQRLADDTDGRFRRELLERLEALRQQIVARRRALGSRQLQRQLAAGEDAVAAAALAVRRLAAPRTR